jgi:hypothetical protein
VDGSCERVSIKFGVFPISSTPVSFSRRTLLGFLIKEVTLCRTVWKNHDRLKERNLEESDCIVIKKSVLDHFPKKTKLASCMMGATPLLLRYEPSTSRLTKLIEALRYKLEGRGFDFR